MDAAINAVAVLAGALLGSLMTYLANIRVETVKAANHSKAEGQNLRLLLKLEFESLQTTIGALKESLDVQRVYSLRWNKPIKKSSESLEGLREKFYLLVDPDLQEKLFTLISDVSMLTSDIDNIETWQNGLNTNPSTTPNGERVEGNDKIVQLEYLKEERRIKLVDIADIRRRIAEVIKELS